MILFSSAAPLTKKPEKYMKYQGPPSFLCNNFGIWLTKPFFELIMGMKNDTIYEMMPVNERRKDMIMDASITNPDMAKKYDEYSIEELQVSTIIFYSKDDKLTDYNDIQKAIRRFPRCTFISFDDGGHLMEGHDAEIESNLKEFINEN